LLVETGDVCQLLAHVLTTKAALEGLIMGIGTGIFLFVVGAIISFALSLTVPGVNLQLVGYLLMGAGVVVFLISIIMVTRKRSTMSTTRTAVDPAGTEKTTSQETRGDVI